MKNGSCWNIDVEKHIELNIKKGMNVFDIGSYIGMHVDTIMKAIQYGKLICIEAQPLVYNILKRNVNTYHTCEVYNKIISNTSDPRCVNLYEFYNSNPGGNCTYDFKNNSTMCGVETTTLDSFQEIIQVIPNIIKISTNSDNYDVILGMNRILKLYKPALYISRNEDTEKIRNYLFKLNYTHIDIGNNMDFFQS